MNTNIIMYIFSKYASEYFQIGIEKVPFHFKMIKHVSLNEWTMSTCQVWSTLDQAARLKMPGHLEWSLKLYSKIADFGLITCSPHGLNSWSSVKWCKLFGQSLKNRLSSRWTSAEHTRRTVGHDFHNHDWKTL